MVAFGEIYIYDRKQFWGPQREVQQRGRFGAEAALAAAFWPGRVAMRTCSWLVGGGGAATLCSRVRRGASGRSDVFVFWVIPPINLAPLQPMSFVLSCRELAKQAM